MDTNTSALLSLLLAHRPLPVGTSSMQQAPSAGTIHRIVLVAVNPTATLSILHNISISDTLPNTLPTKDELSLFITGPESGNRKGLTIFTCLALRIGKHSLNTQFWIARYEPQVCSAFLLTCITCQLVDMPTFVIAPGNDEQSNKPCESLV